jgi:hypothetical protein
MCGHNGITRRHNSLRDAFCTVLASAAIPFAKEVSLPPRPEQPSRLRPADILLLGWDNGKDVAIDFTVSCPTALDCQPLSVAGAKTHLREKEADKVRKYRALSADVGWGFHPAAYSPWGGQGPGAATLLHEVCRRACADADGWSRQTRSREIRQALSLTLAREVAHQLDLRCRVEEST